MQSTKEPGMPTGDWQYQNTQDGEWISYSKENQVIIDNWFHSKEKQSKSPSIQVSAPSPSSTSTSSKQCILERSSDNNISQLDIMTVSSTPVRFVSHHSELQESSDEEEKCLIEGFVGLDIASNQTTTQPKPSRLPDNYQPGFPATVHLSTSSRRGLNAAMFLYIPNGVPDSASLVQQPIVGHNRKYRLCVNDSSSLPPSQIRVPFDAKAVFEAHRVSDINPKEVISISAKFGAVSSWDWKDCSVWGLQRDDLSTRWIPDVSCCLNEPLKYATAEEINETLHLIRDSLVNGLLLHGFQVTVVPKDDGDHELLKIFTTENGKETRHCVRFTEQVHCDAMPLYENKVARIDIIAPENEIDFRFQILRRSGELDRPKSAADHNVDIDWRDGHPSFVFPWKPTYVSYFQQLQVDVEDELGSSRVLLSVAWELFIINNKGKPEPSASKFVRKLDDGRWSVMMRHTPQVRLRVEGESTRGSHLDLAKHISNVASVLGATLGETAPLSSLW